MKRLVIESAFRSNAWYSKKENIAFAQRVCYFALAHGFSPYASHLFFPGILDDNDPAERRLGIAAGLAWSANIEEVWFCLRPEETMSEGMMIALRYHILEEHPFKVMRFTADGHFLEEVSQQIALDLTEEQVASHE